MSSRGEAGWRVLAGSAVLGGGRGGGDRGGPGRDRLVISFGMLARRGRHR
jgi:hypothetical protein